MIREIKEHKAIAEACSTDNILKALWSATNFAAKRGKDAHFRLKSSTTHKKLLPSLSFIFRDVL